jgi:hypothetical protein
MTIKVEWARVRGHRPKVLVQGRRIVGELDAVEVIRPHSHSELVEPHLFVGNRRDSSSHHRAACVTATGLIDYIRREPSTQEDVLETLSAVWCGFPGSRELAGAMHHHDRHPMRVGRNLVERISVVAMIGLTCGIARS